MNQPTIIRSHEAITIVSGGIPYSVSHDDARYTSLTSAIDAQDWDQVQQLVSEPHELDKLVGKFGAVTVYNGHVQWNGEPVHNYIVDQILEASRGGFDVAPLANFLNRVKNNPSRRAVQDLYRWCEKGRLPLLEDGRILAYKIVNHDFTDCYTGKFDNTPGKIAEMPRNEVDEDPNRTCSDGLHFCSAEYLPHYGPSNKKVILVAVDPADVVAFPRDYNLSKARCCRHESLQEIPRDVAAGFFNGHVGYFKPTPGYVVPDYVILAADGKFVGPDDDDVSELDRANRFTLAAAEAAAEAGERVVRLEEAQAAQDEILNRADEEGAVFYVLDADDDYVTDVDGNWQSTQPNPITRKEAEEIVDTLTDDDTGAILPLRIVHEDDLP